MTTAIVGALSKTEQEMLAVVARESNATHALEVGHWKGLSTSILLDNLPVHCELVTIDHHWGDKWIPESSADEFMANIRPHLRDRPFRFLAQDMIFALNDLDDEEFDFVFYDADHTYDAVVKFWLAARHRLAAHCTLVFDDADWTDQAVLTFLAEHDGFERRTIGEFHRGADDKDSPETYTLEVMSR